MEIVPNTENVNYLDEYPEIEKRLWLRRLAKERLSKSALSETVVIAFKPPDPDGAA